MPIDTRHPARDPPGHPEGHLDRRDRRPGAGLRAGQPGRPPAGSRLRLPAVLPAQSPAVPARRGHRRGLPGAGGSRARRGPPHGHPALSHLQGRCPGRRGHRRHALLARRSGGLPAGVLVHLRVGAARGRHPPLARGAREERGHVAHVHRVPARGGLPRPHGRVDAAHPGRPARQGGDGERALPGRPRRADPRRRSRRPSASPTSPGRTGAIRSTSIPATCPCSGRAG